MENPDIHRDIRDFGILNIGLLGGTQYGLNFKTRAEAEAAYDDLLAAMRATTSAWGSGGEQIASAMRELPMQPHHARDSRTVNPVIQVPCLQGVFAFRPETIVHLWITGEAENVEAYLINYQRDALIGRERAKVAKALGVAEGGLDEKGEPIKSHDHA